jgi:alpha-glucosidase (family GH31 glycosyl hydrolase)
LKDIGIDNIKVDMKEMEWGCGLDPCCWRCGYERKHYPVTEFCADGTDPPRYTKAGDSAFVE